MIPSSGFEPYFQGKTALITGASRGIGAAVARRLARAGANLVINYREARGRSKKLSEVLCGEAEAVGVRAISVPADIGKKKEVEALFSKTEKAFGRLDFLVLNAARAPFKPWHKLLERDLRQLVETNYLGNVFCMQQALVPLARQGGGVIFLSSLGSRFASPDYPLGSMKAAMETAVKYWAEDYGGRGISVNAVCAGLVKTDSFKTLRMVNPDLENLPERYFLSPEEIAGVVHYLLGPAGQVIRGQTLVADKGASIRMHWPTPTG